MPGVAVGEKMNHHQREQLIGQIQRLARQAVFGTLSETYRRCGNPKCHCHTSDSKHGPHLYVSYRGDAGKTTGYYVPQAAQNSIRNGIQSWNELQLRLRELAMANKDRLIPPKPRRQKRKPPA
jgi:cytochrome c2